MNVTPCRARFFCFGGTNQECRARILHTFAVHTRKTPINHTKSSDFGRLKKSCKNLEKALVSLGFEKYTGQRRRGRVVEGAPLLRGNTLKKNPLKNKQLATPYIGRARILHGFDLGVFTAMSGRDLHVKKGFLMGLFFIWLAFSVITALAAGARGRSWFMWMIWGFLFGPFALLAVLVMANKARLSEYE